MRRFRFHRSLMLSAVLALPAAATVPARIVVRVGDALPGGLTVSAIGDAFVSGNGNVGLVVTASDNTRSIWIDNGPVWNSSQLLPDMVTGGARWMGISNAGGFVYNPSYNGRSSVVTHLGLLMGADDPLPGTSLFSSSNSRPRMTPDGTAWWTSGVADTPGGFAVGRAMMKCANPGNPSSAVVLFRSGDTIEGRVIDIAGIASYDVSHNGLHMINSINFTGATSSDDAIVVDGVIVGREDQLVAGGNGTERWIVLAGPSINNNGDYLFGGSTTADVNHRTILYCNGAVITRAGQVIDGITLGAQIRYATINNRGEIAFIQNHVPVPNETMFWGPTPSGSGIVRLITTGETIDVNGDNVGDYTLDRFNGSLALAPVLDMPDDGWIYADVNLTPVGGGATVNAVVGFGTPQAPPNCPGDVNGDGSVGLSDLSILLANFGTPSGATYADGDLEGDGDVGLGDLALLLASFGTTCP